MTEITYLHSDFLDRIRKSPREHVHMVLIATKPDIIKQIPLYRELRKRGHTAILGHTGQHYDENLSGGMLKEFGVEPDFNLNVRGQMHDVVSQIIGRLGHVMGQIKEAGKIVIPYVHGDTTTAMAASNAGYCHGFASVHVEAGIRTLTPAYEKFENRKAKSEGKKKFENSNLKFSSNFALRISDLAAWHQFLQSRSHWLPGSQEPYPEQFNTRCSEAATGIHLAPVELDREFMQSEGFADDRIFVVGNSVADATQEAVARIGKSKVFDRHPQLRDGSFVRFCIHRRENCLSKKRFMAIYDAIKLLLEAGRKVLLISMIQTEAAVDRFTLREDLSNLIQRFPNTFVFSPVWAEYADVIAAMSKASVCATDSGSMQEEMNVMGIPCVTLRFGSDRSESALCGGNIIAPPVDPKLIQSIIDYAWDNQDMRNAPKIYGENVSVKCIDAVEKVLAGGNVFRTEEERLRF